jgi:hypothetical protein
VIARALLLLAACPVIASAFSDPATYSADIVDGGGAGRYFTGARVDPYACSVCHRDATTTDFTLDPLPERLTPGQQYDVVVRWTDPETPHALHLELSLPDGAHPSVEAAPETCADSAEPAVYSIDIGARRVVGVKACGASTVSVSFTATAEPIDLAVSAVRGDRSDSAAGDATFERRITFNAQSSNSGGCNTTGGAGLLVALLALTARRRRAR